MIQTLVSTCTEVIFRSKRSPQALGKFMRNIFSRWPQKSKNRTEGIYQSSAAQSVTQVEHQLATDRVERIPLSLIAKFKVLALNAYPLDKVLAMSKFNKFPNHHLFGAAQLNEYHNVQVIIREHIKYPLLNKIGNVFGIEFLDQQFRALVAYRQYEIIYAPYAAATTKIIVLLKALGLIKKPVVILVHQPLFGKPRKNPLLKSFVKRLILSYEAILFFSQKLAEELVEAYEIDADIVKKRYHVAPLGADLNFFSRFITSSPEQSDYLISSGNTGRDFDILVKVAKRVNVRFKIYCKPESFPKSKVIPDNVEILSGEFPFEQICRDIAGAKIVLIPIAPNPRGTIGLVSLLETLALGKPVIMTKNKYIDLDFEKENVGLRVDEDDVGGWVDAISSLLGDHARLKEMSANSLRLAKEKFNINFFAAELAKAMEDTCRDYVLERLP